jgi:hypothetical protein
MGFSLPQRRVAVTVWDIALLSLKRATLAVRSQFEGLLSVMRWCPAGFYTDLPQGYASLTVEIIGTNSTLSHPCGLAESIGQGGPMKGSPQLEAK